MRPLLNLRFGGGIDRVEWVLPTIRILRLSALSVIWQAPATIADTWFGEDRGMYCSADRLVAGKRLVEIVVQGKENFANVRAVMFGELLQAIGGGTPTGMLACEDVGYNLFDQ